MNWFKGDVEEGIRKSITEKKVFIVFIKDENEGSNTMEEFWESQKVQQICSESVCINIVASSTTGQQFLAVFGGRYLPATYLINNTGETVEILTQAQNVDEFEKLLADSLKRTIDSMNTSPPTEEEVALDTSLDNQTSIEVPANTNDKIDSDMFLNSTKKLNENTVEKHNEPGGHVMSDNILPDKSAQKAEDKILESSNKEKPNKSLGEQLKKERESKSTKWQSEKQAEAEVVKEKKNITTTKPESKATRLQFRLPEGSTVSQQFEADVLFCVAYDFISNHVAQDYPRIKLTTVYPKRVFGPEDMSSTLRSLNLVPNASIIVLPDINERSSTDGEKSSLYAIILFILYPLIALFNWLASFFQQTNTSQQNTSQQPTYSQQNPRNYSNSDTSNTARQRFRQTGNVRQLKNDDDDSDENNTWNGNSTQQM